MRNHLSNATTFLAGVFVCLALVWLMEPVTAQSLAKEASGFEVSAWATPKSEKGAYIVDRQTGNVFFVVETNKPKYLGRAAKE